MHAHAHGMLAPCVSSSVPLGPQGCAARGVGAPAVGATPRGPGAQGLQSGCSKGFHRGSATRRRQGHASGRLRLPPTSAGDGDGERIVPEGAFSTEEGELSSARQKLFDDIAPVYDQLNDVLSVGQHRVWKRTAVKWTGAQRGDRCLDVCCGSGDLALRLADVAGPEGSVVGLDFAAEQLAYAAQKQRERPSLARYQCPIDWVQGDAMDLPYSEGEFDAVTMGYGLRNVADIPRALRELVRVLKPCCKVAVLDFNNASGTPAGEVQALFLDRLVVPVARQYGLGPEYEYLQPSIEKFPRGREQVQLAKEAGFSEARHYTLMGGLMGCLVATK